MFKNVLMSLIRTLIRLKKHQNSLFTLAYMYIFPMVETVRPRMQSQTSEEWLSFLIRVRDVGIGYRLRSKSCIGRHRAALRTNSPVKMEGPLLYPQEREPMHVIACSSLPEVSYGICGNCKCGEMHCKQL